MLVLVLLAWTIAGIAASNWAQVSGSKQTNAAVEEPTPWTRRWGHASISQLYSAAETATGKLSRMYVLGGDDRMQLASMKQDFRAYPGGGSFRNDVWATTGIEWNASVNLLKYNQWGDPDTQIVAQLKWVQTNAGKVPPPGVLYSDWIACLTAPWNPYPPSNCDDPTQAPGEYIADAMFSPRRNFAALSFNKQLFVFGGRARELVPVPDADTINGAPRTDRWIEYAILKNDVWKSNDAGVSWSLATIGCEMPNALENYKAGALQFQCSTQKDCFGDSTCKFDPITLTGTCMCNMWSPREYHTVVEYMGSLYLAGGYTSIQANLCGPEIDRRPPGNEYACGGGYRKYMNDVWTSNDGQKWVQLTPNAAWSARGEHAMVAWNGLLWIIGGRTRNVSTDTGQMLLNDVWKSSDGISWTLDSVAAEWSPRAKMAVLPVVANRSTYMILLFGENDDEFLGDVWTRNSSSNSWIEDFGPGTPQAAFVTPNSSVSLLQGMNPVDVPKLQKAEINTIYELTTLSPDEIIALRTTKNVPVCDYIAVAKLIVSQCTISPVSTDGTEWSNVQVLEGATAIADAAAKAAAAQALADSIWDGCSHVGSPVYNWITGLYEWPDIGTIPQVDTSDPFPNAQNSVCRWTPKARSSYSAIVHNNTVFVFGGKVDNQLFENDAWYRGRSAGIKLDNLSSFVDPTFPVSFFIVKPESSSSQTIFTFSSAKAGTTFQYHVTDMVEMLVVRNWTDCLHEIDFVSWLDGGLHRIRLRAIDAAGNVEATFEDGRNEYTWIYVPRLPWTLIISMIVLFFVILLGIFVEWRRRRKQAAMERYAMKRMRRKMRGNKKGGNKDVNWRATYDDAKDAKKKKKKPPKDRKSKKSSDPKASPSSKPTSSKKKASSTDKKASKSSSKKPKDKAKAHADKVAPKKQVEVGHKSKSKEKQR